MKTIRLTSIFLMMILIVLFFSSYGFALGPNDTKDPIKIVMTELRYDDLSGYASAMIYVKNTTRYEVHDFHATIDLYNKKGKKISASPIVYEHGEHNFFKPVDSHAENFSEGQGFQFELVPGVSSNADLQGAYIKPTYTFKIGKKDEPKAFIVVDVIAANYQGSILHLDTLLVNVGEATATNFKWVDRSGNVYLPFKEQMLDPSVKKHPNFEWTGDYGSIVWPLEEQMLDFSDKKHPNINQKLVLAPGQFVRASFEIPNAGPSIPIPESNKLKVILPLEYDSVAPIQDSNLLLMVNNQRVETHAWIENGTTYVPIRALSDALGASISWDEPTQSITVTKGNSTLRVSVDSNRYSLNERVITSSGKAKLYNNTTFIVPLRIVSEAFNCIVKYKQNWGKEMIVVIPK
ncbi:copper amine oxidase N-terminal domain-containing protein [Brevibacillus sp. SYSU BS000544]|uniref:copper amine oxidase N-terminal domain-containing protein n=1 Tax=Brevibacillus sp. SYSU BS000544 TaxID=3416443 RepID=UPI003CE4C9E4